MRNVSGYLTDDGKFFQDKKEAEAHERLTSMAKHINTFVNTHDGDPSDLKQFILDWEKYRADVTK